MQSINVRYEEYRSLILQQFPIVRKSTITTIFDNIKNIYKILIKSSGYLSLDVLEALNLICYNLLSSAGGGKSPPVSESRKEEGGNMSDSIITKRAIAQGFKELMRHKSFEKITIADITKGCGLNRQTFYYHFQDKYELINWIYYNEAILPLTQNLTFETWSSQILQLLTLMQAEAYFYENALRENSRHEFQNYLLCVAKELFAGIIGRIAENTHIEFEDRQFIADFFSFGIVGVIVDWARKGMKETPEFITARLQNLVEDSKKFAVQRYFEERERRAQAAPSKPVKNSPM